MTWRFDRVASDLDHAVGRHEDVIPARLIAAIDAVLDNPAFRILGNRRALATAIKNFDSPVHTIGIESLSETLQDFYRHYAAFRGRSYDLVTWETAATHAWGSARIRP